MNKRQKKKQYKKIYGYNPLNKKKIVNKMGQAIENCIPKIMEIIKDITNRISKTIKNIKEMPEDEFNQIIEKNDMTLEQIALARIIRGRKGREIDRKRTKPTPLDKQRNWSIKKAKR